MGNGIVNDVTNVALNVSASGLDTEVDISAGEAFVEGVHFVSTAVESLDVDDVGTLPTAGQTRIDYVVMEYDPTDQEVLLVVVPGTPATTGAVPPTLTRDSDGIWQVPLCKITRVGDVAVTSAMITSLRPRTVPMVHATSDLLLPADAQVGAMHSENLNLWVRRNNSGTPGWRNLMNPPWTTASLAGTMRTALGRTPRWRQFAGHVEFKGCLERLNGQPFSATADWLTVLSAGSSNGAQDPYARCPVSMSDDMTAAHVQLLPNGYLQLNVKVDGQYTLFLDGVRLPIASWSEAVEE
jgi:hypothetical protein